MYWLAERLRELVNVDTGEPAVDDVLLTDDNYERVPGDAFGDLIIEWNRTAPIETVWSPATGIVRVPYEEWRTGDHHRGGLLLARGPGIEPGRRRERMPVLDIAPTLAASLGFDFPDLDGTPRVDLVPGAGATSARTRRAVRPLPDARPVRASDRRRWTARATTCPPRRGRTGTRSGSRPRTTTRARCSKRRGRRSPRSKVGCRSSRWPRRSRRSRRGCARSTFRRSCSISVVLPTRNRCELLQRAIESVRARDVSALGIDRGRRRLRRRDGHRARTGPVGRRPHRDDPPRPRRRRVAGHAIGRSTSPAATSSSTSTTTIASIPIGCAPSCGRSPSIPT